MNTPEIIPTIPEPVIYRDLTTLLPDNTQEERNSPDSDISLTQKLPPIV
jgi:hypothetical protein